MKNDLVIHTNPHLRVPYVFAQAICRNVESSSAIEGINVKIEPYKVNGIYAFKVVSV